MYSLEYLLKSLVIIYAIYIVFRLIITFLIELPIDLFKQFRK